MGPGRPGRDPNGQTVLPDALTLSSLLRLPGPTPGALRSRLYSKYCLRSPGRLGRTTSGHSFSGLSGPAPVPNISRSTPTHPMSVLSFPSPVFVQPSPFPPLPSLFPFKFLFYLSWFDYSVLTPLPSPFPLCHFVLFPVRSVFLSPGSILYHLFSHLFRSSLSRSSFSCLRSHSDPPSGLNL